MTKEYRNEIQQLKSVRGKLWRDLEREVHACQRERETVMKTTTRRAERAQKKCERAAMQLDRRISILEGRLG